MKKDNRQVVRNLLLYLGIPIIAFVIIYMALNSAPEPEGFKYSDIINYFETDQVTEYALDFGTGEMELKLNDKAKTKIAYAVPSIDLLYMDIRDDIQRYNEANPDEKMVQDIKPAQSPSWFISMLPSLLILGLFVLITFFMMRRLGNMGGGDKTMNFGKAKIKQMDDEKRKTTFEDVAGAEEEKAELEEIVEFLKNPGKFNTLGARIPKGVLLVGPPGTGKTLLARAVAGEAGVPFFSISGSDFVEMFVGVGASRVRDLFDKAKKNHPCIIFIDEIDAVGRQRGAGYGGGHDEREQTLNQLLVEMDGFGANEGVIMIAATNRPDVLDPALMRPGRFDRQIVVGYPDVKGREAILKVHAKGKPLAPDVQLSVIAKITAGFTGADLENLLNEAALLAARKNLKAITMAEIDDATIKVVMGAEKKSHVMSEKDKKLTAYHEGGHAIANYYCPTQDPVHEISIIPRGMAGGYNMYLPSEDKAYRSKKEMEESIVVGLGGRVAEALVLDDISTGASGDIQQVTKVARAMITKYGMSETLGPVQYGQDDSNPFLGRDVGHVSDYSQEIAAKIDKEIRDIVGAAYDKAEDIMNTHIDKLHAVAGVLFEKEKIGGEEFRALMESDTTPTFLEASSAAETTVDAELAEDTVSADVSEDTSEDIKSENNTEATE